MKDTYKVYFHFLPLIFCPIAAIRFTLTCAINPKIHCNYSRINQLSFKEV